MIDIIIGYKAGTWAQKKFAGTKFDKYIARKVSVIEKFLGEKGSKVAFTILGFISINYFDAFLASWTKIPLKTIMKYLMLGEIIWFATALLAVAGVAAFVDPLYTIYVMIGISLVFAGGGALVHRKMMSGRFA